MRLIPSSPLSCLGTAVVAVVIGGFALVGCDVVDLDEFDTDFSLFSGDEEASPSPGASASPSPGEEEGEPEDTAEYALPESCAEAGAAEVVGDLAPGTVLAEDRREVDGFADAEQLTCSFSEGTGAPGAPTFTLVFTLNVDPSLSPDVVAVPGAEEEMNWEVDIDVDVDTYHTDEADSLGGDLEYVGTVDGSTRHLYLSLPGELYVTAIAYGEDVPREELERVVLLAAERVRG
ncbi:MULTISPECIES: hypothetical protein [Nocardiopsis]|uniref:DUF3558 domain-containing protein n=1 Tax=Nocardiopsis lambiniae TaxID=3075539 RepID=A0ABU2MH17_9ACTN|nr:MULTISPECIES: hypothetical protein [unclassified Nocardiopsis]MDE3725106.1 hypothetical protein [Nocardiopsis sp. N85]MDT0331927.1 hypothetical protein [Nocardiopsis sp. DSM 44743]